MPRKLAPDIWLFGVAVVLLSAGVLLLLVLVSPFGQAINGTRRWIRLGIVSFQPAELAKLALVIYLAAFLAKKGEEISDFRRGLVPPLAVAGLLALLVLAQPDLGNCLTLITLTFTLLFLAGGHARHLGLILLAALPPLIVAIWMAPYRLRRIFAFIDPCRTRAAAGFRSSSRGSPSATAAS